jgi:hypothetical protein
MTTTRRVAIVVFALAVAAAVPVRGMIRTLPLLELVTQSDVIVTAVVEKVTEAGKGSDVGGLAVANLRNELRALEPLKGSWPAGTPIVLSTIKPRKGWLEDNVEIPPPASQVLLFLGKDKDGKLVPVNGIQGVWPMEAGRLLGMGFGKSLADVRNAVKKGHAAATFAEGLALQQKSDLKGAIEKYKASLLEWPDAQLQGQVWSLENLLSGRLTSTFKTDYIPCGQADLEGEEVPSDFSMTSGGGPSHAEWGLARALSLNAKGEVVRRTSGGRDLAAPTDVPAGIIARDAVRRIYAQVIACGFFELEKEYWDRSVMDGGSSYLTVTAGGRTHTVTLVNHGFERVGAIVGVLEAEITARRQ